MYMIGIDVGGTKIEGVALDSEGREILRLRQKTLHSSGYENLIKQIAEIHSSLTVNLGKITHSLGICTPGAMDRDNGKLRFCNIGCMNGENPLRDLQDEIGMPLALTNDANSFALAETRLGAGRSGHFVFGMVLGTGCGGGLVVGGDIWEGRNGIAGEWGHSMLYHGGHACYCGRHGCVERYLSGTAIEQSYCAISGRRFNVPEILNARKCGEPHAIRTLDGFLEAFGLATANLIKIFDPDIIVLGGGISNIDEIYREGAQYALNNIMGSKVKTQIIRNELGDSAGVLGAALHGYEVKKSC